MIRVVVEASGGCGLKINKGKSSVLMYNCGEGRLEEVGGIRVANTIRYLGVDLGDSRVCFREYQKGRVRLADITLSVIARSCNKIIGKTYWKSVVQPRVLSAAAVVRFGKSTRISMISNSVTHLRSYTNSAIAGKSAPISPVTPRVRRRRRADRRRPRIERRYRRIE